MNRTSCTPRDWYRRRRDDERARREVEERVVARISWLRLAVAIVALGGFLLAVLRAHHDPTPWLILALGAGAAFFGLVGLHDRRIGRLERTRRRLAINERGLARLDRRWSELPPTPFDLPSEDRPTSRDLGLFGEVSLYRLLAGSLSPPGRATLGRWLLESAAPEEVGSRQEAIRELARRGDDRQALAVETERLGELTPEIGPFLRWAEADPWLLRRPTLVAASRFLPPLTLALTVATLTGYLPLWPALAAYAIQVVLANLFGPRLHRALDAVSHREREMQTYADALRVVEGWSDEAWGDADGSLARDLDFVTAPGPSRHLEKLHRRLEVADVRHSGTLHFVLATGLLWDFHTLHRLETWRETHGGRVREWLDGLGRVEALCALADLHYDEPEWAFAHVDVDGESVLEARDLGHPLLPAQHRVTNDVTIGPPGRFLLVTGSNMSGKSTLLRAIGLDVALAQAGAPACATSLSLPPVRLATSILVEDSLADGTSLFLAELLRLRSVVRAAELESDRRLLFLLDEILRGTNSEDRHLAVRTVLRRLLDAGAIGAISTHDIALGRTDELGGAADLVHFRETVLPDVPAGEIPMDFDYTLRPGLSTTTNALELLRWVGLGPEHGTD